MASNDSSPKALPGYSSKDDKAAKADSDKAVALEGEDAERLSISGSSHIDDTHRMLKSRHIQLIGIGGTIGTVLFVRSSSFLCFKYMSNKITGTNRPGSYKRWPRFSLHRLQLLVHSCPGCYYVYG